MEKRDLEKLRREHKDRFGKAKESSRRNSNEVSGSAPASKRNEEAKPTNEAISENPSTPISKLNSKGVKKPKLKQNLGSRRSDYQSKAKTDFSSLFKVNCCSSINASYRTLYFNWEGTQFS